MSEDADKLSPALRFLEGEGVPFAADEEYADNEPTVSVIRVPKEGSSDDEPSAA